MLHGDAGERSRPFGHRYMPSKPSLTGEFDGCDHHVVHVTVLMVSFWSAGSGSMGTLIIEDGTEGWCMNQRSGAWIRTVSPRQVIATPPVAYGWVMLPF